MKTNDDIQRIIYWWARYCGRRHPEHDKIWTAKDIEILQRRIEKYLEFPFKFDYSHPHMGIDELGWEADENED